MCSERSHRFFLQSFNTLILSTLIVTFDNEHLRRIFCPTIGYSRIQFIFKQEYPHGSIKPRSPAAKR